MSGVKGVAVSTNDGEEMLEQKLRIDLTHPEGLLFSTELVRGTFVGQHEFAV